MTMPPRPVEIPPHPEIDSDLPQDGPSPDLPPEAPTEREPSWPGEEPPPLRAPGDEPELGQPA